MKFAQPARLIGLWLVPAALTVLQMQTSALIDGQALHSLRETIPALCEWMMWVPLTPVILRLAARFPPTRELRWPGMLVHVCAIFAVSTLRGIVYAASVFLLLGQGNRPPFAKYAVRVTLGWMPFAALLYGGVVAASVALAMTAAKRERDIQASELRAELARAELQALRTQLHPHFLFNALHSVAALARAKDTDATVNSVSMLADMLRELLVRPRPEEVDLAQELEFVRRYLAIEQLRFHDRLCVEWSVADGLAQARVPTFVIQTLVENAIRHGISARIEAGRVTIDVNQRAGLLQVTVTDDGPGPTLAGDRSGGGLTALRARLGHHYGSAASMSLARGADRGAIAQVTLPLQLGTSGG